MKSNQTNINFVLCDYSLLFAAFYFDFCCHKLESNPFCSVACLNTFPLDTQVFIHH